MYEWRRMLPRKLLDQLGNVTCRLTYGEAREAAPYPPPVRASARALCSRYSAASLPPHKAQDKPPD